jgi:hypothetical protein
MTRIRERTITNDLIPSSLGYWAIGSNQYPQSPPSLLNGQQRTVDVVHQRSKDGYREGDPFDSRSSSVVGFIPHHYVGSKGIYSYDIRFLPNDPSYSESEALPLLSDSDLLFDVNDFGAEAVSKFKPGRPQASVGQFLAELRDTPRLLMLRTKNLATLGASAHINAQFGWLPLLSDLRSMYRLFNQLEKHLNQLRRDNGRSIRRKGQLRSFNAETEIYDGSSYANAYPALPTTLYRSQPHLRTMEYSIDRIWFAGQFKYWIPDIGTSAWTRRARTALFGLNPTPKLLWDILPWSWLVDWFGNIGDVLDNISANAAENLIMEYGYLMYEHQRIRENVLDITLRTSNALIDIPGTSVLTYKQSVKQRVAAHPYGFGITNADLNLRQWSILSALGLLRAS